MTAIANIKRKLYIPYDSSKGCPVLEARITENTSRREEILSYQNSTDWFTGQQCRISEDNGRTWTNWQLLRNKWPYQNGYSKEEHPFAYFYDKAHNCHIRFIFQRLLIGQGADAIKKFFATGQKTFYDHSFWSISTDNEKTWSQPVLLRYELGPDFDNNNWASQDYLQKNQAYCGLAACQRDDGAIIIPATIPLTIVDRGQQEIVDAVICFIGTWHNCIKKYVWEISQPIAVPHRISGRGLMEPAIAKLRDGRIMLELRGSNKPLKKSPWQGVVEEPGRKWLSISGDQGYTWTAVSDLRYDNGEHFYAPSSLAKIRRHSNGKLYWFGNICDTNPDQNRPRYPLYIAQIDEDKVALKKETLTIIDTKDPEKDKGPLQLSNFSIFENPETHQFELYLTRYGENENWLDANVYKYTLFLL